MWKVLVIIGLVFGAMGFGVYKIVSTANQSMDVAMARLKGGGEAQRIDAEEGQVDAQFNLGLMYYAGDGVLKDRAAAYMWFSIAALKGHAGAAKNRDITARQLSSSGVEDAQKRAKRCMVSDYKDCDAEAKSWWQKLTD